MAGGVFISYRREDAQGTAGRIYDRLIRSLDRATVFFDVDDIEPGFDFVDVLSERVGTCDALAAIIGRQWINVPNESGLRRLDDPNDFVRIEIEAALARKVRVIPVLVDGARMPKVEELPEGMRKLARRQAIEISHTHFDADAGRLVVVVQRALQGVPFLVPALPSVTSLLAEELDSEQTDKGLPEAQPKPDDRVDRLAKVVPVRTARQRRVALGAVLLFALLIVGTAVAQAMFPVYSDDVCRDYYIVRKAELLLRGKGRATASLSNAGEGQWDCFAKIDGTNLNYYYLPYRIFGWYFVREDTKVTRNPG